MDFALGGGWHVTILGGPLAVFGLFVLVVVAIAFVAKLLHAH